MTHVIEMFLDEEADQRVQLLWSQLSDAGIPSLATYSHGRHRPHVTLCGAPELGFDDLAEASEIIAGQLPTLTLGTLGAFPGHKGALFLGVVPSVELLDLNARLHAQLVSGKGRQWRFSGPGQWVPHCTLANGLTAAERARGLEACADFESFDSRVSAICVIDAATGERLTVLAQQSSGA
ncbi:2'-5' RNA ligase family protein [Saccharopolyspora shandongensis]|uniref:2'-5' RNA ligase family protein n=1 Tax=Saccharopolyspora shandongensis TaxID=418495 RepID=UPI0033F5015F